MKTESELELRVFYVCTKKRKKVATLKAATRSEAMSRVCQKYGASSRSTDPVRERIGEMRTEYDTNATFLPDPCWLDLEAMMRPPYSYTLTDLGNRYARLLERALLKQGYPTRAEPARTRRREAVKVAADYVVDMIGYERAATIELIAELLERAQPEIECKSPEELDASWKKKEKAPKT